MERKHFVFLFLVLMSISFVSAVDTKIEIKTLPNHEVYLNILNPTDETMYLKTIKNLSDYYGDTSFVYSSNLTKFDLKIILKKDGMRIYEKVFKEDFSAGVPISRIVAPEGSKLLETPGKTTLNDTNVSLGNQTLENLALENQTEEEKVPENESEGNIVSSTGLFIFDKSKKLLSSNITYYVAAILIVGLLAFVARRKFGGELRGIKIKKLSELNSEREEEKRNNEKLREAERRLKEAQEEVSKLKNEDKIEEMEERIRRQQEELEKLRRGDD